MTLLPRAGFYDFEQMDEDITEVFERHVERLQTRRGAGAWRTERESFSFTVDTESIAMSHT